MRGGRRPGAGRPKGPSQKVARLREAVQSGLTPLEYLLGILRNEKASEAVRMDAAKSAAPYVHPKLANIEATHKGDAANPLVIQAVDADI